MTYRSKTSIFAVLALAVSCQVQAQGLRLPANTAAAAPIPQTQADFIVAVVNSEPITNNEVRSEAQRMLQQLAQQHRPAPAASVLAAQVLEELINQKAQLQLARDTGLRAEESAIDQAEQSIALQNQFDVAELHRRLEHEGQTVSQFRAKLADQILLQRLRERDVQAQVRVTEQEINASLGEQQASASSSEMEINLAQILVSVPESASAAKVEALRARAQLALERARRGEDFTTLVREFSEASDLGVDGQLGLRTASRYPELFVKATEQLAVGDVTALVRSPAGFHILKVIEKVTTVPPAMTISQSHVRHILLIPSARLSEADARQQLLNFKKQVQSKQADFATLAREHSQDGSAADGGDLGWASPGMFVPEFEATMNRLAPGEVSDPLLSRFGLHLIQLLERRSVALSAEQQREAVRATLHEKKLDEAYRIWAQDVRGKAYVEMREPPL